MANVWGRLSPALQGTIIGGLIGFFSSLVTGVAIQWLLRWWRRKGRVRYHTSAWTRMEYGVVKESRSFTIRLRNERDIGTALWNLRFVFYKDGVEWLPRRPIDADTKEPTDVLDLPSQVTVSKILSVGVNKPRGRIPGDELIKVKESDKIEFVADIPGKGEGAFRQQLPLWDDHEKQSESWQHLRL